MLAALYPSVFSTSSTVPNVAKDTSDAEDGADTFGRAYDRVLAPIGFGRLVQAHE